MVRSPSSFRRLTDQRATTGNSSVSQGNRATSVSGGDPQSGSCLDSSPSPSYAPPSFAMQRTYTPTADGLSHARAREGGGYPKATGTAPAFTYGRSETVGQTTVTARYFHDGWNRGAEYSGQDLATTYTWRLDLSGTLQGAGGVGGLLAVSQHSGTVEIPVRTPLYPTFDGNGNISEYLDAEGIAVAHFEYDPFGNLVVDSFENAADFPYRFSTKPQDMISGWYYYGYRCYDPLTGRWPLRDPIGESGGVNLYGFVGNDGVGWVDADGLQGIKNSRAEQKKRDDEERLLRLIPPRIEAHQGPKELMVVKADIDKATVFFGFVAAREALRLTLAPLQGLEAKDIAGAIPNQKEHAGSVCAKCIECANGDIRYHVMFVGPVRGAHRGLIRTMPGPDGNVPAICPVDYHAVAGYHSHPIDVGGTSGTPTAPGRPGSDTNSGDIKRQQDLANAIPGNNFKSAYQSPNRAGVTEYISGISGKDEISVWRRPGDTLMAMPPQPTNNPCPDTSDD